jgi:hypothetical protein
MGWVAVATWVLRLAASAGAAASHTVANTGINVETSDLPALNLTLPLRISTKAPFPPVDWTDAPDDRILS